MNPVRVIVVDDSATMRNLIGAVLREDPEIEVVGLAANAHEARQAIKALNPDVVTLDVEMPEMDGLAFLEKIMRLRPTPVIMVSSLTSRGAAATIEALEIGAFDCVTKPSPDNPNAFADLAAKVKAAAGVRVRPLASRSESRPAAAPRRSQDAPYMPGGRIVAIGASTGGVEALVSIISQFPSNCPPTVITQHMPANFTKRFAERLNRLSAPQVSEAVDGAPIVPGQVYVAPGETCHLEVAGSGAPHCRLTQHGPVSGHRPSVDVLFASVAKAIGRNAVGVILTGMGRDGAEGLLAMRQSGAVTLGQDEATSLVYGMPKVAFELGAIEKQVSLHRLSFEILNLTHAKREGMQ